MVSNGTKLILRFGGKKIPLPGGGVGGGGEGAWRPCAARGGVAGGVVAVDAENVLVALLRGVRGLEGRQSKSLA